MTRSLSSLLALLVAVSPAAAQAPAAASALTRIGAAAAVAGKVQAVAPGTQVGRVVASGKPIFLNDHVTTDAAGRLQVMLLDETVFTLGPDSDMVLDEYVYDPGTHEGKMVASVAKGAFRFVSGRMSHETGKNMKVNLPSGTMGIRGTIAGGVTDGKTSDVVLLGPGVNNNAGEAPGSITVTNNGVTVVIETPGFGTHLVVGQPPASPSESKQTIKLIMGSVASNPKPANGQGGAQTAGATGDPNQGPSNVTSTSGQETASGGSNANTTQANADADPDSDNSFLTVANQDASNHGGLQDGLATFDQIEAAINSGVLVGQDIYSMSGAYSCTGGSCSSGTGGTASVNLTVDWAARTIGSFGSHIYLNSGSGAGTFGGDDAPIFSTAFPSTSGPAVISVPSGNFGTATNLGTFQNMTVTLLNSNGVVAHDASVGFTYMSSTSAESVSGGATGPRAPAPPN